MRYDLASHILCHLVSHAQSVGYMCPVVTGLYQNLKPSWFKQGTSRPVTLSYSSRRSSSGH